MTDQPKPAKRRGFISFQNPSGRPVLSREEYAYWANHMPKVLKVSTEFEQNLPSAKASLEKKANADCSVMVKGCVPNGCVHLEECMESPHPSLCQTRKTGKYLGETFACPAASDSDSSSCASCPSWALNCEKTACSMFLPFCSVCPSFSRFEAGPEEADFRHDAETVRQEMKQRLLPTGFVGDVGLHGVLEVKKDNSLQTDGGIEIPTVGRRFHWGSFYQMCKNVLDPLLERGAYVDERAGQHFHILAGYFPKDQTTKAISELEKPMPEIILANLHQLHRRYELAMFWIMSAGTHRETLTRWARFRQTIFPYSTLRAKMPRIVQELAEKIICMNGAPKDGKYASVAYYLSKFNEQGDVSIFHFENRIADAAQSPAVVTAWAALCYALVLKAVRCSQYGIVEVGTKEYVNMVREIQPNLIEGGNRDWGSSRKADTSGLTDTHIDFLENSAREMVNFLKPELSNLGPAYAILESLATRPCSIRLCQGQGWQQIESELMALAPGYQATSLTTNIQELVDLSGITECQSIEEWVAEVAAYLGAPAPEVADTVMDMINHGLCRWSNPLGSVIAL